MDGCFEGLVLVVREVKRDWFKFSWFDKEIKEIRTIYKIVGLLAYKV